MPPELRALAEVNGENPRWSLWQIASMLCFAACLSFVVDLPIAYVFRDWELLQSVERPLQVAEPFGDVVGLATVILLILAFDRTRWTNIWRTVVTPLAASGLASIPRLSLPRVRPAEWSFEASMSVVDTFRFGPLALANVADGGGFVSAGTAMAVALGLCLERRYPQGRWLFRGVIVVYVLQRIDVSAHFLSDLLFGSAIGCASVAFSDFCLWIAHRGDETKHETEDVISNTPGVEHTAARSCI